jgi:hypothetical protein
MKVQLRIRYVESNSKFAVMHRSLAAIYFTSHKLIEKCWKMEDIDINCDGHYYQRPYEAPPECYLAMWIHINKADWVGHNATWGYARD